jgi:hypothetical protein
MLGHDRVRELLDLVAVHGFDIQLIELRLGHSVPLPKEAESPDRDDSRIEQSIRLLRRWLALLDLAIPPVQIRDAIKSDLPQETTEALMRYFIDKRSPAETDRDKADFIATCLLRTFTNNAPPLGDVHDRIFQILQLADSFEQKLMHTVGEGAHELPPQHRQLVGEFEYLHQEIEDFKHFDQLMDSGIVQRVRDIKQSFGDSFYHPKVLANVALYNAYFGKRFDDLFRSTTEQLKAFAAKVQEEGASIMSKVEGDVTVKHLAEVDNDRLMSQEYGRAQENFRKISSFKKVVDKRGGARPATAFAAAASTSHAPATAHAHTPHTLGAHHGNHEHHVAPKVTAPAPAPPIRGINPGEESKINAQLDAMRSFVRIAEKSCHVIPLTKGNVSITPSEAEALRAEFAHEKSFRADFANATAVLLALLARLKVEDVEFAEKQASAYLWKPHADAIAYVIQRSQDAFATANQMIDLAEKRGLNHKAAGLKATSLKLRQALTESAAKLKTAGS